MEPLKLPLSVRENQILWLNKNGTTYEDIAYILNITGSTVGSSVRHAQLRTGKSVQFLKDASVDPDLYITAADATRDLDVSDYTFAKLVAKLGIVPTLFLRRKCYTTDQVERIKASHEFVPVTREGDVTPMKNYCINCITFPAKGGTIIIMNQCEACEEKDIEESS